MLEIVKTLPIPHFSGSRWRTVVIAKCLRCGRDAIYLRQNVIKHNRLQRTHCAGCVSDKHHRMTGTRIWSIWQGMRARSRDTHDKNYGGRGIDVCPEWHDFSRFYEDMSIGYSDELTIERIDVNKPYSKSNCRWASNMEQQANKRNNRYVIYLGEKMHLAELVRRSGVSKMMLTMRLNRGMTADEAVTDAKTSHYGKGPRAAKRRMSTTSLTADHDTDL